MKFFNTFLENISKGFFVGVPFVLVVSLAFGAGILIGNYKEGRAQVVFWHLLEEKYLPATTTRRISNEEKLWGAISGLTQSLGDPYTTFLPPVERKLFEEDISGSFGGVGMEIGIREEVLTVISPLKDTPAERAGLRAGDKILAIDGKPTQGFSIEQGVGHIRGPIGSKVVLTILREGNTTPFEVEITRASISIPTIDTDLRQDDIFVIKLYNFSATSPNLFRAAMREFIQSGSNKLILDLRGNPGGFLEASVDVASWFLPVGAVVVEEYLGKDEKSRFFRSKGYNVFGNDLEMVVLINQGSASASEILAGALSEHRVATLIGMKTFGKGSVQELLPITDTTSLKVTVAHWLTPNGNSFSEKGLEPDIEVEITEESLKQNRDLQMERAVDYLLRGF